MSTEAHLFLVFKRHREGLTPDETAQLDQWLAESPEHRQAAAEAEALLGVPVAAAPPVDTEAELQRLKTRLRQEAAPPVLEVVHRRPAAWRWAAAAAVALLVGAFFWVKKAPSALAETVVVAAADSLRHLTLPDGSRVTLRQGAELRFPNTFDALAERQVQLSGEAFFEVHKDPAHPFVVAAGGCQTKVLGTQFNVRAAAGEPTVEVAVREGRVQVSGGAGLEVLQAGQGVIFDKNTQKLALSVVEPTAVADWQAPDLQFRQTPLGQVADRLSRRFNQKITLDNTDLAANCTYTAYFPRAHLPDILKNLESTFDLRADLLPDGSWVLRGGRCPR